MRNLLYIDPGLGSLIIQALVGAIAAGGAAWLMFKQKIANLFRRSAKKDADEEVKTEKEQEELQHSE
jgi:hypothetical protein